MASSQEGGKATLLSPTDKFDLKLHVLIFEHLLERANMQWNDTKNKLQDVLTEEKIELMRGKAKMECLLEQMKSVQDEFQSWKMPLSEIIENTEFALHEMEWMLEAPELEMQLQKNIGKSELLLEEMQLVGLSKHMMFSLRQAEHVETPVNSPMLEMNLQEHISNVESLLENKTLVQEESKMGYPMLRIKLKENKQELEFLLKEMKFVLKSGKVVFKSILQEHIVTVKSLLITCELKEGRLGLLRVLDMLHDILVQPVCMEWIQKEKTEAKLYYSLQEAKESVEEGSNVKYTTLRMQFNKCIVEIEGIINKLREANGMLKKKLYSGMLELEHLLENMKLKQEVRFQALEMELKEDIKKLELLLEGTKLEERHVAKLKGLIEKAKKVKLTREESKTESLELEKCKEELKSLLWGSESMELSRPWNVHFAKRAKLKLGFLQEGMKFEQKEEGLQSKALETELEELELLVRNIESEREVEIPLSTELKMQLEGHLARTKFFLKAMKLKLKKGKLDFSALKVQLKERMMQIESTKKAEKIQFWKTLLMKQLKGRVVELKSLQEKARLAQWIGKLSCRPLECELNRHIKKLVNMNWENVEVDRRTVRNLFENHVLESELLLDEMESERDLEILLPLVLKIILEGNSVKANYLLAKHINFVSVLEAELEEHLAKLTPVEMKLKQDEERLGFHALKKELEEHLVKSELLLTETKLICDEDMLESPVYKIQLKQHLGKLKSRLAKLGREKRKLDFPALEDHIVKVKALCQEKKSERKEIEIDDGLDDLDMELKENIVSLEAMLEEMKLGAKQEKLESSLKQMKLDQEEGKLLSSDEAEEPLPQEQKAPSTFMTSRPLIVIGGRGQDGESLRSVEGFMSREGRWIELPAMNIPRSFMASVVVDQEVIVSGGDTGDAITDTIEVLNLAETPLQWKVSPARLPVPLSAHQTVVYKGRLIVIGGHDGKNGRYSKKIYEICLTPPYESRILSIMLVPMAWHGAELVGHEIFIFGGGRNPFDTTSDVLAFDLSNSTVCRKKSLPRAMKGMATVIKEQSVAVVGGLDESDHELNEVFMYDTGSGENHSLPQMKEKRGGCSAVTNFAFERSASCSSEKFTDALFVLGSMQSLKTVEGYSFESNKWVDLLSTREARGFCSMVVAPMEFEYE